EAAISVLTVAGCRVHLPKATGRPLCCGRTFLAVGKVDEARREAQRCVEAFAPFVTRGIPVAGLEPSCLIGFRDEIPALLKSEEARWLASRALLLEEFVTRELVGALPLPPIRRPAPLTRHCHPKSFAAL